MIKHETDEELERIRKLVRYDKDTGLFWWTATVGKETRLNGHRTVRGYVRFSFGGVSHHAHRLAYALGTGAWPKQIIDHINRDPSDNRLENLRDVSQSENLKNSFRSDNANSVATSYRRRKQQGTSAMVGKPRKPYLRADWKLSLPAELAARIDLMLEDPLTRKPKYAARARLVEGLLRRWIAETAGDAVPSVPTLTDLRESSNA